MVNLVNKVTLSGFLNFIDGLWSRCGDERIIIARAVEEDENNLIEVPVDDVVIEDDLTEDKDKVVAIKEVDDSMKSPKPTLYEHTETPGGSVYWETHVKGIPVPEEGKYYDTIEEAIDMYGNYAEARGFQIKKAGQRLTKSGIVQLKYIICNKEGAPRHINIDTLDAKHSDKQKRNTTMHVTGSKAL
ncbi:FAR1 DNA binding domain-containing protein [Artemisia annua]|uniref:FAR1 DNA binding domain-containing protein n=1 Tax=Artemisia annua TaxID=35608 RepID=A0A2U1MBT6_ARTAN|nr:FAR1 DNA binding domain-containing protein [Artemisia annua]